MAWYKFTLFTECAAVKKKIIKTKDQPAYIFQNTCTGNYKVFVSACYIIKNICLHEQI